MNTQSTSESRSVTIRASTTTSPTAARGVVLACAPRAQHARTSAATRPGVSGGARSSDCPAKTAATTTATSTGARLLAISGSVIARAVSARTGAGPGRLLTRSAGTQASSWVRATRTATGTSATANLVRGATGQG